MTITAAQIAQHMVRFVWKRKLLAVPETYWTGYECDLLVIEPGLRIIDCEIKVSRSDLRADAGKDKWWKRFGSVYSGQGADGRPVYRSPEPVYRPWPPRVWKHYYCLPESVYRESDFRELSPKSGVVLIGYDRRGALTHEIKRRCQANPEARPVTPAQAVDIARLAGLRLWDALAAQKPAEEIAA